RRFSPNIPRYMAPSIVPSMRLSRLVPLAEKQPQSIMFPPPCLMVGMVFLGSYSAFAPLQTRRVELMPKSLIFVSYDHILLSQSSLESFKCPLANFRRPCTCAFLSRATLRVLQYHCGVVCCQWFSWWLWSQLPCDDSNVPP